MQLEEKINSFRAEIERLEKANRNSLRIGYTQMQEAVPTSFGRLFSAYNDAFRAIGGGFQNVLNELKLLI